MTNEKKENESGRSLCLYNGDEVPLGPLFLLKLKCIVVLVLKAGGLRLGQ